MRFYSTVSSLLLLAVSPSAFASSGDLSYRLEYRPGPNPELAIELAVQGEADGTTEFSIPEGWAGQSGYEKGILDLAVAGGTLRQLAPNLLEVSHAPGAALTVSYRLVQHWSKGIDSDGFYWPAIRSDFFHFFGHAAFVTPEWKGSAQRTVHLRWEGLPAAWEIANSHGAGSRTQVVTTTLNQFSHAVFLAGDFRLHRIDVAGKPVYAAIRGAWSFTDKEFLDLVHRVFLAQRDFFQDHAYPYYFLSLMPSESGRGGGGTGLTDSFAMHASAARPLKPFEHLLAHELFHNWNGRKIRRQQPEELVYWFSEGFTEYFARKIKLQAGIIDLAEYVDGVNRALGEYFISPARNAPNDRILKEFWTDEAIGDLPYLRGELVALLWNARIRQRDPSRSLDDFMRDLFREATTVGTVVAPDSVDRLMRTYLAEGVQADLDALVDKGGTVVLPADALGPCVSQIQKTVPTFDLGFDVEASYAKGAIVGVQVDSKAYLAGLRDGLKLVRIQNRAGDPFTPVIVTVEDAGGAKRDIQYDPHGPAVDVPQFVLDAGKLAADWAGCLSWFR